MEVADPADHGSARHDLVDVRSKLSQERAILGVAFHEPIGGMIFVASRERAVLAEIVEADDLMPGLEELRDQIPGDETSCTRNEGPHLRA